MPSIPDPSELIDQNAPLAYKIQLTANPTIQAWGYWFSATVEDEEIAGTSHEFLADVSTFPASVLEPGTQYTLDGGTYYLREAREHGTGLTVLVLEEG